MTTPAIVSLGLYDTNNYGFDKIQYDPYFMAYQQNKISIPDNTIFQAAQSQSSANVATGSTGVGTITNKTTLKKPEENSSALPKVVLTTASLAAASAFTILCKGKGKFFSTDRWKTGIESIKGWFKQSPKKDILYCQENSNTGYFRVIGKKRGIKIEKNSQDTTLNELGIDINNNNNKSRIKVLRFKVDGEQHIIRAKEKSNKWEITDTKSRNGEAESYIDYDINSSNIKEDIENAINGNYKKTSLTDFNEEIYTRGSVDGTNWVKKTSNKTSNEDKYFVVTDRYTSEKIRENNLLSQSINNAIDHIGDKNYWKLEYYEIPVKNINDINIKNNIKIDNAESIIFKNNTITVKNNNGEICALEDSDALTNIKTFIENNPECKMNKVYRCIV